MAQKGRKLRDKSGLIWDVQAEIPDPTRLILLQLDERARREIGAFLIARAQQYPDKSTQSMVASDIGQTDYELQALNHFLGVQILTNKEFDIDVSWDESTDNQWHATVSQDPSNNFRFLIDLEHPEFPYGIEGVINDVVGHEVEYGTPASVSYDPEDGIIHIYIPKGKPGDVFDAVFWFFIEWYRLADSGAAFYPDTGVEGHKNLTLIIPEPFAYDQENTYVEMEEPGSSGYVETIVANDRRPPDAQIDPRYKTFVFHIPSPTPGTDGINGEDGLTPFIIHTYQLNPGDEMFIRAATAPEIALYVAGTPDPGLFYLVAGVAPGFNGQDGEDATINPHTVLYIEANPIDACDAPNAVWDNSTKTYRIDIPVYCPPPPPPPPPGTDGEGKRCNVANGTAEFVIALFNTYLDYIEAQLAVLSTPAQIILGLLGEIPIIGNAVNFLRDSVSAVVAGTVATIRAQINDPLRKEAIACSLYCKVPDNGELSDAVIAAWLTDLYTSGINPSPLKEAFDNFVKCLDYDKLRQRAYTYGEIESDCSFCEDCEDPYDWERTFDFTANEFADLWQKFSPPGATWVSGQGIKCPNNFWYLDIGLQLRAPSSGTTIEQIVTKCRSVYSEEQSSGYNSRVRVTVSTGAGSTVIDQDFVYPLSINVFTQSIPLDVLSGGSWDSVRVFPDTSVDDAHPSGDHHVTIERITMRGMGTEPVWNE